MYRRRDNEQSVYLDRSGKTRIFQQQKPNQSPRNETLSIKFQSSNINQIIKSCDYIETEVKHNILNCKTQYFKNNFFKFEVIALLCMTSVEY